MTQDSIPDVPDAPDAPDVPLVTAPARAWVAYDLAVRRKHYWFPDPLSVPARVADAGVALCHGDGRVREAALRAGVGAGLLPLVVVRGADWAGAVREAARAVLARTPTDALAEVAHVVLRIGERAHGGHAVRLLKERLGTAEADTRRRVLTHPAREVRRWGFQQAVDNGWLSPDELAAAAVREDDVLVQTLCAEAALGEDAGNAVPRGPLDLLLTARAARVRAVAVTALRRAGTPEKGAAWLDDRSAAVRECAQWAVRVSGGDPAAHYRDAVSAGPGRVPRGAVAGLGECGAGGSAADAELVTPFLADDSAGVRAAAVGALSALAGAEPELVAHLLDDPSPAVVGRVARALAGDADTLPLDGPGGLLTRLGPDREKHIRRAAFQLLAARGGLEPLRAALSLVDDPELWQRARALAARWSPTNSASLAAALPPHERALLAAEITRAEPCLPPHTGTMLRWVLRLREE
ncbi:hypothetical protein [Streptomyces iconiensis]|uniref:HEAT repeat n=1 Tax=Streptomyces iconiensis TaxID=1384038 RepID=A0ABT7AAJ6_9ACTN|nr:hypothetical protein [Streptomyces iconiensis]MDJ1138379.1 hypothetical protein [Streptomyces iconiensis]